MVDCRSFVGNRFASPRNVLKLALSVLFLQVVVCWSTSQCKILPGPNNRTISICPTHTLNGSTMQCHGKVQFQSYMNSVCNDFLRERQMKRTVTLELLPGIHKITIDIPVPGKARQFFGVESIENDYLLYTAIPWICDYPPLITSSDRDKTIILLESESNAQEKKTKFEDYHNIKFYEIVPIYFSSTGLVSFRSLTFRSAVPYTTYALMLFDAERIELSDCNFPDLNQLHGGIAIKPYSFGLPIFGPEPKKSDQTVLITNCKFNISYTGTVGPGHRENSPLAPALWVGTAPSLRTRWMHKSIYQSSRSFHVQIQKSSFQVFEVTRKKRRSGRGKRTNSKAYRWACFSYHRLISASPKNHHIKKSWVYCTSILSFNNELFCTLIW